MGLKVNRNPRESKPVLCPLGFRHQQKRRPETAYVPAAAETFIRGAVGNKLIKCLARNISWQSGVDGV